ncbi:MAG: hypothetical protein VKJ24_04285 [Synechococcales bacterium]|nr:hypothetical protein [Synechococcales bacterium]
MTSVQLPFIVHPISRTALTLLGSVASSLLILAPIAQANTAPLSPTPLAEAPQVSGQAGDLTVQSLNWRTGLFCTNGQTGTAIGACGGAMEPSLMPAMIQPSVIQPNAIGEATPFQPGVVIERNPNVEVDLPRPALAPLFQIEPKRGSVQPMQVEVP